MAVQRLSLDNIKTELLRIAGYESSARADWQTDANLYRIINMYGQRLSLRAAQVAREAGLPPTGVPRFDMYKTRTTVTLAGGETSSDVRPQTTFAFPEDYDHWISFYDLTHKRPIRPTTEVSRWHLEKLKQKPLGPPEAIEIVDAYLSGSTWQRRGFTYPPSPSGVNPTVELWYYRLPAIMAGTSPTAEYIDADVKYHSLWIYGPAVELLRPDDPVYDRYASLERELLLDLVYTGRAY